MKATINMSYREIILRRVTAAVCWSLALQAVLLVTVLFVLNFNPWHPILWTERTAALSVSMGTWLYFFPVGLAICMQSIISYKDFMVVRRYCGTRFALYCNMFTLYNLIMFTLYAVTGGLISQIIPPCYFSDHSSLLLVWILAVFSLQAFTVQGIYQNNGHLIAGIYCFKLQRCQAVSAMYIMLRSIPRQCIRWTDQELSRGCSADECWLYMRAATPSRWQHVHTELDALFCTHTVSPSLILKRAPKLISTTFINSKHYCIWIPTMRGETCTFHGRCYVGYVLRLTHPSNLNTKLLNSALD